MSALTHCFAAITLVVLAAACSEATNGTGSISKRLGETARAQDEVDLRKMMTFGWDRFHVLKPGTTRVEVCAFIGADRRHCGRVVRIERAPADHMVLLFSLGGQLTHLELHALANGQFDMTIPPEGFPRDAALFRVRRNATAAGEALWLEPVRALMAAEAPRAQPERAASNAGEQQ